MFRLPPTPPTSLKSLKRFKLNTIIIIIIVSLNAQCGLPTSNHVAHSFETIQSRAVNHPAKHNPLKRCKTCILPLVEVRLSEYRFPPPLLSAKVLAERISSCILSNIPIHFKMLEVQSGIAHSVLEFMNNMAKPCWPCGFECRWMCHEKSVDQHKYYTYSTLVKTLYPHESFRKLLANSENTSHSAPLSVSCPN